MSEVQRPGVAVPLAPRGPATALGGSESAAAGREALRSAPSAAVAAAPEALAHPCAAHGVFAPLLLLGLAVLGWALFQMRELGAAHASLARTLHEQQPRVVQALRLRAALTTLAGDTRGLADAGDPSARLIVAQLKRRGITIAAPAARQAGPLP
jgi:hypothetical protein